jgi:hypothetical protein
MFGTTGWRQRRYDTISQARASDSQEPGKENLGSCEKGQITISLGFAVSDCI